MKRKYFLMILFAVFIITLMLASITGLIDEHIGMCVSLGLAILFTIIVAITAYKNGVTVIMLLMIVLTIAGIGLLAINIYSLMNDSDDENTPKFYVSVNNNNEPKTKLFSHNGIDFYSYNTGNVKVNLLDQNRVYSLEDAITLGHITLDEILSTSIPSEGTKGYKIYYDGGLEKYENDEYSLIVCETSKDVIFAPYNYTYTSSICEN